MKNKHNTIFLYLLFIVVLTLTFAHKASAVVEISDGSVISLYHFDYDTTSSDALLDATGLNDLTISSGNSQYTVTSTAKLPATNPYALALHTGTDTGRGEFLSNVTDNICSDGGDFAIGGWIKGTSNSGDDNVFTNFINSTQNWIAIYIDGATNKLTLSIGTAGGASDVVTSNTSINDGTWYWFVATRDGSHLKIYINGADDSSSVVTDNLRNCQGYDDYLGDRETPSDHFAGSFDEFFFMDRDLTADEISAIYNSGNGDTICTTLGCSVPPSESFSLAWVYPTTTSALNVNDNTFSTRLLTDIVVSSTQNVFRRFRISATSTPGNYLWDSGPIQTYGIGTSTIRTLDSFPDISILRDIYPTTTSAYFTAWLYTVPNGSVSFKGSSTIQVMLDTTTTPAWYDNSSSSITLSNLQSIFHLELETCPNGLWANLNTSAVWCHAKNAFKTSMSWLFIPTDGSLNYMRSQYETFKNTFPFVLVFGTADRITEAMATTTDYTTDLSVQLPGDRISATTTIILFSSSSLTSGWGQSAYNAYSNFVLTAVATVMIIMLIGLI